MGRTILLTRPQAQSQALAETLAAHGWTCLIAPLLTFEPLPPPTGFDALLDGAGALAFTSANGVRAFAASETRRDLPVFAVGDSTAAAAREAGFGRVASAAGNVEALAGLIRREAPGGPALHIRGAEARGDLTGALRAAGIKADEAILYEMRAADALPADISQALAGDGIQAAAFYSPRTAQNFADLAQGAGLPPLGGLSAAAISAAAAAPLAGLGLARIVIAEHPDADGMLRAIESLESGNSGTARI